MVEAVPVVGKAHEEVERVRVRSFGLIVELGAALGALLFLFLQN